MSSIKIGPWEPVGSSEGGSQVATDGDRIAVGGPGHVVVWAGERRVCGADSPWPAPGAPRFQNDRLLWGPGILDLRTGNYETIEASRPNIWPGGGERPHVYAWSADGHRLVATYSTGNSDPATKVVLFDGVLGQMIAAIWSSNDIPPQAAWVGSKVTVVGFRDPRVFDSATGAPQSVLGLDAGTITRIESDLAELRLIAVDLNRSIVWIDQLQWTIVDRWEGRWQDAAISPDGRFVAALDMEGRLSFACLTDSCFQPVGAAVEVGRAASIALMNDSIGIAAGGMAARARLHVECSE